MTIAAPLTAAVTIAALAVYFTDALRVARARSQFKVVPPSIEGPPEFARIYRIQVNTLEQIVLFLPVLWLCAAAWGDRWTALIGVVWPIGRIIYARGYAAAAEQRHRGFAIAMFATMALALGAIAGIVAALV